MDIDVALETARDALAAYRAAQDAGDTDGMAGSAATLADSFGAIDGWMSARGFAPAAWPRP